MGKKTGRPRGRPLGAQNKITMERQERINQAMAAAEDVIADPFRGDAHALLIAVYKNEMHPLPLRLDAAKAAIGYEKPRLASTEMKLDDKRSAKEFSTDELEAILAGSGDRAATQEAGESEPDSIH